jgi:hypothetical protein
VFFGMALLQVHQHLVGQLPDGQLVLSRDLQGGQQPLEDRVPDVAFRGRHVGAGVQDHVATGDQPVVASLALVLGIDLDAAVAQGRIVANFAFPHARPDRLAEHPGEFVDQSIGVDADRHQGDPQPDVVAVARAEPTGARLLLLEMLPVGRVLEPVHPAGVGEPRPLCRWHGVARISRKIDMLSRDLVGIPRGGFRARSTRSAIAVPSGVFLRRCPSSSEREPRDVKTTATRGGLRGG